MPDAALKKSPRNSLKKVFNESAAQTVQNFPVVLENLYITSSTVPLYVSPQAAKLLNDRVLLSIQSSIDYMVRENCGGVASSQYTNGKSLKIIALADAGKAPRKERHIFVSKKTAHIKDLISVLDHELAHHIVREGTAGHGHMGECAADAYAALRHVQRFGGKTDFFDYAPFTRARVLVHGTSSIHYTSIVIQKIQKLQNEIDISALTLQETALLAGKIAREYRFDEGTLDKISRAFKPIRFYLFDNGITKGNGKVFEIHPDKDPGYFTCLFEIIRAHKDDHDIYRAGKLMLSVHMKALRKNPVWRDDLDFMARHEKDSGIILNLADAMDADREKREAERKKKIEEADLAYKNLSDEINAAAKQLMAEQEAAQNKPQPPSGLKLR